MKYRELIEENQERMKCEEAFEKSLKSWDFSESLTPKIYREGIASMKKWALEYKNERFLGEGI